MGDGDHSGRVIGETTNSAPATMEAREVSASRTVPTPIKARSRLVARLADGREGVGGGHGDFNRLDATGDEGLKRAAPLVRLAGPGR